MKVRDLLEAGPKDRLEALIRKHCAKNFKAVMDGSARELFRSTTQAPTSEEGPVSYTIIPARSTPRKSTTGSNFALNYSVVSPDWKKVPSREMSSLVFTYDTIV